MIQNVKGTTDYFPDEMEIRKKVFDLLSQTAERFGFREVDCPAIESFELLKKKQGQEIKEQIFNLRKKGSEELALRAELTPSFARMFIQKQKSLSKPVKWFAIDKVWRYERPQKGRLREFFQYNVELFGSERSEADAEIINLLITSLRSLGLKEDMFSLKLNNRKLLQGIVEDFSEDTDEIIRIIDKRSKVEESEFIDMLKKAKVKDPKKLLDILKIKDIKKLSKLKLNEKAQKGYEELKEVMNLIDSESVELSLETARGLAYYTGTVFEVFDKKGKLRSIAGGGRYDNLIEQYEGQKTAAVGFGLGYATLSLLLEQNNLLPRLDEGVDYFIAVLGKEQINYALKLAKKLRKKYSVDIDLNQRNLGNQLKYASSINAKKAIIIGEEEVKSKILTVKDLNTGKQEKVKESSF